VRVGVNAAGGGCLLAGCLVGLIALVGPIGPIAAQVPDGGLLHAWISVMVAHPAGPLTVTSPRTLLE
jgi:hypothetical protein